MKSQFTLAAILPLLGLWILASRGLATRVQDKKVIYFGQFGNKMYYVSEMALKQSEAEAYCQNDNMQLVSIETPEEQEYMKSAFVGSLADFHWTSLRQKVVEPEHFYWKTTGITHLFNNPNFGSYHVHIGLCVAMGNENGGVYAYMQDQCDRLHPALCQMINK